jgi:hypothetical protein
MRMAKPNKTGESGWLKNDNPPGNPSNAPRCGAKTRRQTSCHAPAMPNGRCRMHGGASTGPRTPKGLARSNKANWKHGHYSAEAKAEGLLFRELLHNCRKFLYGKPRAQSFDFNDLGSIRDFWVLAIIAFLPRSGLHGVHCSVFPAYPTPRLNMRWSGTH